MPEKEQLPMEDQVCAEKVAEKMSPVKEHLVNEEKSSCAPSEVICENTTGKDQLSLEDQVYAESVVEKMSPVKEHLVNEEKSFCAPSEVICEDTTENDLLSLEDQVCVDKNVEKCVLVFGTSPAIQSIMNGIENSPYGK
ncbi:uncharacterized protein LOC127508782 isoform X2 [Ctenopharyngodon idella]|uniref:uncharacterized protein LOC127508782 isoform X2 n=1 Tax=Ctenopharyngodon idella TaxID=7959 RepID=UPI0022317DF1|nr:uncharacterized protein LOC127508782 isoform X2 [Ctenopharyngodon idella]